MVSVIVPNFNKAPFIRRSLDSLVGQTSSDWEAIVVDDCSSDGSWDIIREYARKPGRIIALRNKTNRGGCYSRNRGARMATGEFLIFLDSDDALRSLGTSGQGVLQFAERILAGETIKVFNHEDICRDFMYIDDIAEGLVRCVYAENLLTTMIEMLSRALGVSEPKMEFLPLQSGDVYKVFASIEKLNKVVDYEPTPPISVGLPKFVEWLKEWRVR